MWIKLDRNLLNSTPIRKCATNLYRGDRENAARVWICIQMLVESASDYAWYTHQDLSTWLNIRGKSAQMVWNICIESGVLQRLNDGRYNAKQWLLQNKYIGDYRPKQRESESRTEF